MKILQSILRYSIIGGLLLSLFTPLIVSNSLFFPFITGKAFYFRIVTEIVFALWLMLAVIDPAYRPRRSWVVIALGVFMVVVGIADAMGINPSRSFWSNFERMEGYITLLHLTMYFIVASSVLATEGLWALFLNSSIGVSVFLSIYSFLQIAGKLEIHQGGVRVDGTLGNAAYLAVYMLFNIFFVFYYMLRYKNLWSKVIYGVVLIMQLITIYYTATRGAILGLLGGLFIASLIVVAFERENKKLRTACATVLGVVIVVGLGFFAVRNTSFVRNSPVLERFASISLHETTTESRFIIWNMAWQGVKERPLLGWGQENFNIVFNKYYDPRMYNQEQWFDRAHDIVFDWLINAGILGLALYISLFVAALYMVWKKGNFTVGERAVMIGLLVAYLIHNLFVFDNLASYMAFFAVLAYVHWRGSTKIEKLQYEFSSSAGWTLIVLILIATPFAMVKANSAAYHANTTLIQAMNIAGVNEQGLISCIAISIDATGNRVCTAGDSTENLFKKALSYNTFGNSEIREQILNTFSTIEQASTSPAIKAQYYQFGMSEMYQQTQITPNDARTHFIFATYLFNFGKYDDAIAEFEKARALSPHKQAILITEAQAYLLKKDFTNGLSLLKEAYESAPNYDEAKKRYVYGLLYAGKQVEAQQVVLSSLDPIVVDQAIAPLYAKITDLSTLNKVAQAYTNAGSIDIAKGLLTQYAASHPQEKAAVEANINALATTTKQ